jgi:hypothetical protein
MIAGRRVPATRDRARPATRQRRSLSARRKAGFVAQQLNLFEPLAALLARDFGTKTIDLMQQMLGFRRRLRDRSLTWEFMTAYP